MSFRELRGSLLETIVGLDIFVNTNIIWIFYLFVFCFKVQACVDLFILQVFIFWFEGDVQREKGKVASKYFLTDFSCFYILFVIRFDTFITSKDLKKFFLALCFFSVSFSLSEQASYLSWQTAGVDGLDFHYTWLFLWFLKIYLIDCSQFSIFFLPVRGVSSLVAPAKYILNQTGCDWPSVCACVWLF